MKALRLTQVRQLRPQLAIDEELDWFFNQAECDMGLQSNYLQMLGAVGPGSAIPSPEDAAEAAHRHRRIRGWLRTMDSADAGVLQCAYELRDWPVALWDRFGRRTGVVVRLACALDDLPGDRKALQRLERERAEWMVALGPPGGWDATWTAVRREAEARFARAHRIYGTLRGAAAPRTRGS